MAGDRRLYLDTNALILLNEGEGSARHILEQVVTLAASKSKPMLVTSTLTLSELLVKPYRNGETQLIAAYRSWFGGLSWLEILPVLNEVLDLAAFLRANQQASNPPDAIHVASALVGGARSFLSADLGIDGLDRVDHPILDHRHMSKLDICRLDEPSLTALLESLTA
jgi:predicted nucleic acid-binding protein